MGVIILDYASVSLESIVFVDALIRDACKQIDHSMRVSQMLKIGVDLGNKATGSAAMFADFNVWDTFRRYPSGLSSKFRGSEFRQSE